MNVTFYRLLSRTMSNCIFICFDEHYFEFARACINSITENYPGHPTIVVLYTGNNDATINYFKSKKRVKLLDADIDYILNADLHIGRLNNKLIYLRYVMFSNVFDEFDKVLYLDIDVLVLRPLNDLFEQDGFFAVSNATAMVSTFYNQDSRLIELLRSDGILCNPNDVEMINSGVLLVPKNYRTQEYCKQLWDITLKYRDYLAFGDQSAFSIWMYLNKIPAQLRYEYNFQVHFILNGISKGYYPKDISIAHFAYYKPHALFDDLVRGSEHVLSVDRKFKRYSSL